MSFISDPILTKTSFVNLVDIENLTMPFKHFHLLTCFLPGLIDMEKKELIEFTPAICKNITDIHAKYQFYKIYPDKK